MQVKDLIELLSKCPKDDFVTFLDPNDGEERYAEFTAEHFDNNHTVISVGIYGMNDWYL